MGDDKLISLSSSSEEATTNSTTRKSSQTSDLISLTSDEDQNKESSRHGEENESNHGAIITSDIDEEEKENSVQIKEDNDESLSTTLSSVKSDRIKLSANLLSLEGLEISSSSPNDLNHIPDYERPPTVDHDAQTSRRPTMHKTECKYGYHFPSSPTSSMISELARQVEKSNKPAGGRQAEQAKLLLDDGKSSQLKRLQEMFPTATGPIIEQIIQIYNGREGLIKAGLISLGYKRAVGPADKQASTQNAIVLMMAKQSSRRLFDKLLGYFPDRDEDTIKRLMYELKEVEHEIISALASPSPKASSSSSARARKDKTRSEIVDRQHYKDKETAIMKLRFLKTLFPQCEETELDHLLYCHNLNAQNVIQALEKQGHTPVNINQIIAAKKTKIQQAKARQQASRAAKDRPLGPNVVELHKSRSKPPLNESKLRSLKQKIAQQSQGEETKLKELDSVEDGDNQEKIAGEVEEKERDEEEKVELELEEEQIVKKKVLPDELIALALQAAENNEELAKTFLDDLGEIDDEHFMIRLDLDGSDVGQQVVLFPCKGIQKSDTCDISLFAAPEYVSIPWDVVHCQTALALPKVDACTFTSDDFQVIPVTHRVGACENLAKGSKHDWLLEHQIRPVIRRGRDDFNKMNSVYKIICELPDRRKPKEIARGANASLRSSSKSQRQGHNANLVKRIHPFYIKTKKVAIS